MFAATRIAALGDARERVPGRSARETNAGDTITFVKHVLLKPLFWFWLAGLAMCWHLAPWRVVEVQLPYPAPGFLTRISLLAVGPDALVLSAGSGDCSVVERVEFAGGKRQVLLDSSEVEVKQFYWYNFQFSPDGKFIAIDGADGSYSKFKNLLIDTRTTERIDLKNNARRPGEVLSRFSPDSGKLVQYSGWGVEGFPFFEVYSIETRECIRRIDGGVLLGQIAKGEKFGLRGFELIDDMIALKGDGRIAFFDWDTLELRKLVPYGFNDSEGFYMPDHRTVLVLNKEQDKIQGSRGIGLECRDFDTGDLISRHAEDQDGKGSQFPALNHTFLRTTPFWEFWKPRKQRIQQLHLVDSSGNPFIFREGKGGGYLSGAGVRLKVDPSWTLVAVQNGHRLSVYRIPPDRSWRWFGVAAGVWTGALCILLLASRFIPGRLRRRVS